eukprot:g1446.t1
MLIVAPYVQIHFLGSSLTFMMVYLWGRRNPHVPMAFFVFIPFPAPYLPWVFLLVALLFGNSLTNDLLGIAVGHIFYFLEDVYPRLAKIRGWPIKHFLRLPAAFGGSNAEFVSIATAFPEVQVPNNVNQDNQQQQQNSLEENETNDEISEELSPPSSAGHSQTTALADQNNLAEEEGNEDRDENPYNISSDREGLRQRRLHRLAQQAVTEVEN